MARAGTALTLIGALAWPMLAGAADAPPSASSACRAPVRMVDFGSDGRIAAGSGYLVLLVEQNEHERSSVDAIPDYAALHRLLDRDATDAVA
jgi:hypothetical protein